MDVEPNGIGASNRVRIALIHWFPLEHYPPATNALDCFASRRGFEAFAFSSENSRGRAEYANPRVEIVRHPFPDGDCGRLIRVWRYILFPLAVVGRLIRLRPDCVLYYEPQSSLPALIYAAINWRCRILIHHHEYHEPAQFLRPGMRLVRFYHWLEKRFLFRRAVWISHTNERRLELFHADHPTIDAVKLKVMGNFPPASWPSKWLVARGKVLEDSGEQAALDPVLMPPHLGANAPHPDPLPRGGEGEERLRLVYVGSVSLHDTFIGPLVDWILARDDDNVTLDVFAYNADQKTKEFLRAASGERREARESLLDTEDVPFSTTDSGLQTPLSGLKPEASSLKPSPRVRYFEQGVDYDDLPQILAHYDVGVILYRCNTTNYKFNASNKLFEYLACGLEVWYPPQMLGVKPYARQDAFPRVLEVDFEQLHDVDLQSLSECHGLPAAPPPPCCEDEFAKLLQAMQGDI